MTTHNNIPLKYFIEHPEIYEQTMTNIDETGKELLARITTMETVAREAEKQLRLAADMAYTPKAHVEFLNAANMLLSALQEQP